MQDSACARVVVMHILIVGQGEYFINHCSVVHSMMLLVVQVELSSKIFFASKYVSDV